MSADNCIAILKTTDKFKVENKYTLSNTFGEGITAYRVVECQAVDNFQYFVENEPHNIGYWMYYIFGDVPPSYDYNTAREIANILLNRCKYVEYGIIEIDASKYNFPGC